MEPPRLELAPHKWLSQIEAACEHDLNGITPLEVIERAKKGEVLCFVIDGRMLLVVEILELSSRVLNVALLAGEGLDELQDGLMDFLERLAKDQFCTSIRAQGRQGWNKVTRRFGYETRAVIVEKVLT